MAKDDSAHDGSTVGLLSLAALPFAVKGVITGLGLPGYGWQSLYKLAQLAGPVWWRGAHEGKRGWAAWWPVDEPLPSAGTWAGGVLIAVALQAGAIGAVTMLAEPLGLVPESIRSGLDAKFAMTPLGAVAVVVYLLSLNAGLEELHFRAWLDRNFSARWGSAVGIAASAILFAAMHMFIFVAIPSVTPLALSLVLLGLLTSGVAWSLLARRPGGIHAAWLSHGLTDAVLLTWGLFWLGYF